MQTPIGFSVRLWRSLENNWMFLCHFVYIIPSPTRFLFSFYSATSKPYDDVSWYKMIFRKWIAQIKSKMQVQCEYLWVCGINRNGSMPIHVSFDWSVAMRSMLCVMVYLKSAAEFAQYQKWMNVFECWKM